MDTSPEKVLPESSDLFTRVAYTNHYTWRTVEEERMFQAWFDGWVNANRRDVHQSYASKYVARSVFFCRPGVRVHHAGDMRAAAHWHTGTEANN